ncbi:hypothetical protein BS330_12975 [Amycolatopsis keratiniphila subsp. nogabecina]|nr:hypothetical protein BS330_12975 [Amycolatopsis keratiniphila subsp. nogabecina]
MLQLPQGKYVVLMMTFSPLRKGCPARNCSEHAAASGAGDADAADVGWAAVNDSSAAATTAALANRLLDDVDFIYSLPLIYVDMDRLVH